MRQRLDGEVHEVEGAIPIRISLSPSIRCPMLVGILQLQAVLLLTEVVGLARIGGLRSGGSESAVGAEPAIRLQIDTVVLVNVLGILHLTALMVKRVGHNGREHPLHLRCGQVGSDVAVQGDGRAAYIIVVCRNGSHATVVNHLGTVDAGIGQGDVGLEVAQRVGDNSLLFVALHAEEPSLGLSPLDIFQFSIIYVCLFIISTKTSTVPPKYLAIANAASLPLLSINP